MLPQIEREKLLNTLESIDRSLKVIAQAIAKTSNLDEEEAQLSSRPHTLPPHKRG